MAGMGPPPKPPSERVRRNAPRTAAVQLPSEGRTGPVPTWPLPSSTEAELDVWESLWTLPQAVMWERQRSERFVARYVRCLVAAERVDAPSSLLGEVRQMEDRLGLSPLMMQRMSWEVVADEVAEKRAAVAAGATTRSRVRAVDPALVARDSSAG